MEGVGWGGKGLNRVDTWAGKVWMGWIEIYRNGKSVGKDGMRAMVDEMRDK